MRSNDARTWQPDTSGQELIDRVANLKVVSERCSRHFRSLDDVPARDKLWKQLQTDFLGDPDKYPAAMANLGDKEGRAHFRSKYEAICFPPESAAPCSPEDYIMMIFAAQAGLQSITSQELYEHPYRGEIQARARFQAIKELEGQSAYDRAIEDDKNRHENHTALYHLHDSIECKDTAGEVVEYIVVDCATSVVNGNNSFILEDEEGRQMTIDDFYKAGYCSEFLRCCTMRS